MKLLYFLASFLLGALLCNADDEADLQDITKSAENSSEEFFDELKEFFEKKCKDSGKEDTLKKLSNAIDETKTCVIGYMPKTVDKIKEIKAGDSSEDLCFDKRKEIKDCFDPIIGVWEDCSVPEEKYIIGFVADALDSLFQFFCADKGAVISSLVNENTIDCIFSIAMGGDKDVCKDNPKLFYKELPEDGIFKKSEVCHDLKESKKCITTYINKMCPNETALATVVGGALDAIASPCDKRRRRNILRLPLF